MIELTPNLIAALDEIASNLPNCTITIGETRRIYTCDSWEGCHALYSLLFKHAPRKRYLVDSNVPIEIRKGVGHRYSSYFPLSRTLAE